MPNFSLNRSTSKLSAGMDRWQNTLEEMISLRSSSAPVFKDNYWAQNGFDELRRYVKQGSDFSKELASILQERIEAELNYSKCLSKLGAKLGKACKESVGSCMEAWKHVAIEMEEKAEIHRTYSNYLSEELVKPMKNVNEGQLKLRKKIEGVVDEKTRALAQCRTAEAKSKKQSHNACRENEKLQDLSIENGNSVRLCNMPLTIYPQFRDIPIIYGATEFQFVHDSRRVKGVSGSRRVLMMTARWQSKYRQMRVARSSSLQHIPHVRLAPGHAHDRDRERLQVKRRKTEEAVKKAEAEYYTVCVHAERTRLEWESAVVKGAGMMEALEEERLTQMKNAADIYLKHTSAVSPQLSQCTKKLVGPMTMASPATDMAVIRNVRSVPAGACQQLLPDFYCEHTALAMNKERRKQALMKILQLIKQDIDRERKSKQGLEKLSLAMKQTPTFGSDDSQQNVADKLYHVRAMLTYLEATRYKLTSALNELDKQPTPQHPLAAHIEVMRDKQGLQQSILKVPPWLQNDYQMEVNRNLQPNYQALSRSVTGCGGGEHTERRDSIKSNRSKLRIDHVSFRSAPTTPVPPSPAIHTPSADSAPSDSPLGWSDRGAADGLSNQHDSDFDEFSSQSGGSTCDLTEGINQSLASPNGVDTEDHRTYPKSMGKCRALYDYSPKLNDELTLTPGDIIDIHEKQDDGWWSGNLNGAVGIFPATYVEEITTCI